MRQKILVVDDEPEAVELVKFNLKQAGYQVSEACDGGAQKSSIGTPQPDRS
jgi:DNA-binding response OmpR family regulator